MYFVYFFHTGDDSWKPMILALEHLKTDPTEPAYDMLFSDGIKFQYPLTSLLLFDLPNRLIGVSYLEVQFFLDRVCSICVILLSLFSTKILINVLQHKQFERLNVNTRSGRIWLYFLVLVITFLFYPILRSYALGQVQTLLTFLTAIVILCWQKDKKISAGIIIGLVCLIKPQLGLLFLWGIVRRQWAMVIAGASVITVFGLISILLYGFGNNLYYLEILSFLSRHGEAFYANQSINGMMNRLMFNGENLDWTGNFPNYIPFIHITTMVTSVFLMVLGLSWNFRNKKPQAIELSLMILCTIMASPIAWEHHYAILLTIFLLMSPYVLKFYEDKKWSICLFAVGYLLVSQYYEFTKNFADTTMNVLQSYLFFGACIILYFLLKVTKINQHKDLS